MRLECIDVSRHTKSQVQDIEEISTDVCHNEYDWRPLSILDDIWRFSKNRIDTLSKSRSHLRFIEDESRNYMSS